MLVERKDLEGIVGSFTEDGVFIDPHYPDVRMQGREEIREGVRWGLAGMRTFRFIPRTFFLSEDGTSGVLEVDSHHVLANGRKLDFQQVFIAEVQDGLLKRFQAYEPYGPSGVAGVFLGLGKAAYRLKRRLRKRRSPSRQTASRGAGRSPTTP